MIFRWGAGEEPTSDQFVAMIFGAAMSGNEKSWARANEVAQEYIIYLEKVLRMIRIRAGTAV